MKPVLVLQHLSGDGPAYLGTWLRQQGLPFEVRNSEAGDALPDSIEGYAALAVLGGEMSANDPLPALRQAERLILEAFDRDRPVIGHCLGGQLMARALGARVVEAPAPEIGWHTLHMVDPAMAGGWFGSAAPQTVFEWHYETFDVPHGATRIAGSAACANQAFAIGRHLAMQFHVEVDAEKLGRWAADRSERFVSAVSRHPSAQSGDAMLAGAAALLQAQQALADCIYRRWIAGSGHA